MNPPVEIRWHQGERFAQSMPDDEWLAIVGPLRLSMNLRTTVSFTESNYDEGKNRVKGAIRTLHRSPRKLGCDEDPAHFDEILKKVARHKAPPDAPIEAKKPKTKKVGL